LLAFPSAATPGLTLLDSNLPDAASTALTTAVVARGKRAVPSHEQRVLASRVLVLLRARQIVIARRRKVG